VILRVLLLLLVAFVAGLPSLAHASPPDPTWMGGLWDDADHDDVIALITSFDGAPSPNAPRVPALTIHLAGFVPTIVTDAPLAERLPAFLRRAPPIA